MKVNDDPALPEETLIECARAAAGCFSRTAAKRIETAEGCALTPFPSSRCSILERVSDDAAASHAYPESVLHLRKEGCNPDEARQRCLMVRNGTSRSAHWEGRPFPLPSPRFCGNQKTAGSRRSLPVPLQVFRSVSPDRSRQKDGRGPDAVIETGRGGAANAPEGLFTGDLVPRCAPSFSGANNFFKERQP